MVSQSISRAKRIDSSIVSLGLARQAEDEGAVDQDADFVAVAGEAPRAIEPHALLDVLENLALPLS